MQTKRKIKVFWCPKRDAIVTWLLLFWKFPREEVWSVTKVQSLVEASSLDSRRLIGLMENSVDALEAHFRKAHATLLFVQHKLELEFSESYEDYVNPMKLLSRIRKIQEDLPAMEKECGKLIASKQDLIDAVRQSLAGNRTYIRNLQARAGLASVDDAHDPVFSSFQDLLKEWDTQLGLQTGLSLTDAQNARN